MIEVGVRRVYEVGYLLLPSVPEERVQSEVLKIKDLIKEAQGTLISEEDPKYRTLAYEMVKRTSATGIMRYTEAYFGWMKFEADASHLPLMKDKLDHSDTVLRYLLVKTVREDTFRSPTKAEDEETTGNEQGNVPAVVRASPEELDKSIDALVAE